MQTQEIIADRRKVNAALVDFLQEHSDAPKVVLAIVIDKTRDYNVAMSVEGKIFRSMQLRGEENSTAQCIILNLIEAAKDLAK